jgi:hypothetical protein
MSFLCPDCSAPRVLYIALSIELPPDSRSDEITLQIVECSRCDFAGIAVYEESRRGRPDDESFDHTGYHVSKSDLRALRKVITSCPDRRNPRCTCAAHRTLGRKRRGRWDGLSDVQHEGAFRLQR